jgi:hypothetical protein
MSHSCHLFETTNVQLDSRTIRPDMQGQAPTVVRVHWCSHSASPVTKLLATRTIGGGRALRCGGDLAQCQVPVAQR